MYTVCEIQWCAYMSVCAQVHVPGHVYAYLMCAHAHARASMHILHKGD